MFDFYARPFFTFQKTDTYLFFNNIGLSDHPSVSCQYIHY